MPSAVLLVLFAFAATAFDGSLGVGLLHGLKVVAVAVVARAAIGLGAVVIVVASAGSAGQADFCSWWSGRSSWVVVGLTALGVWDLPW